MDVVISGATGLIGAALWTSLRADGHRVLRLRRGGITDDDEIGWDPQAGRIDAPALEDVDAVVHLAGESIGEHRGTDEQKQRIRDSRVRGTAVLAAAVATIRAAIDDERFRGPVNLTAPNPVTNHEFAQTLGRVLHRPAVLPTPMSVLKLRYGAELVETLLLVSQRVLPAELEANGFRF